MERERPQRQRREGRKDQRRRPGDENSRKTRHTEERVPEGKRVKRQKKTRTAQKRPQVVSSRERPEKTEFSSLKKQKRISRDPRFERLGEDPHEDGAYTENDLLRDYQFVDTMRKEEVKKLSNFLSKNKEDIDQDEKRLVKDKLTELKRKTRETDEKRRKIKVFADWKKREAGLIEKGKTPFFLKDSQIKKLEIIDKFQELKKSGKLDAFVAKKRKKNANKIRGKLTND